jgi:hypothetical protein
MTARAGHGSLEYPPVHGPFRLPLGGTGCRPGAGRAAARCGPTPHRTRAGITAGTRWRGWGRTVDISQRSGDRGGNLEEKVGISREPLDPRTDANHSVNCSGHRSSTGNWRRSHGRAARHPGWPNFRERWVRRLPTWWSGDGLGCSSGACRSGTRRRVVRHGSARARPCLLSTWPRGAWAVSAARLLGAASRPDTWRDGRTGRRAPDRSASVPFVRSVPVDRRDRGRRGLHPARVLFVVAPLALQLQRGVGDAERPGDG